MEWQIVNRLTEINDGYDGYKVMAYLDGYLGVEGYEMEYILLKDTEIQQLKAVKNIFYGKISKYSNVENPSQKILNRLSKVEFLHNKYLSILNAIGEGD